MNENANEQPGDRLVTLKFIADSLSLSTREVQRNRQIWVGFPSEVDISYKVKRFSYLAFQAFLK
jgi:hypothetical protein